MSNSACYYRRVRSPEQQERFLQKERFESQLTRAKLWQGWTTLRAKEAGDAWLRYGLRLVVLILGSGTLLLAGAYFDTALGGSVSGITRLAWLLYLLFAIMATPLALILISVGLIRRYGRK